MLIIGNKKNVKDNVYLGKSKISACDSDVHLCLCLSNGKDGEMQFVHNKIRTCKTICYGIQSLGSHTIPTSPVVQRNCIRVYAYES